MPVLIPTMCYPFQVNVRITTDWKEKVMFNKKLRDHSGIDFGSVDLRRFKKKPYMANYAALKAEVLEARQWGTLGWGVQLYYPEIDVTHLKLHLESVIVKKGDQVKWGQTVGYCGKAKGQTIDEHDHEEFVRGRRLATGLMSKYTLNPWIYFKQMKLKSEVEKANKITKPPVMAQEPVKVETATTRAVETTVNYAAPVAGVSGAAALLFTYFMKVPPEVAIALVIVVGAAFNVLWDLYKFKAGK